MSTKMGITMIEMYCKMVKEQFAPIKETLDARDMLLKEECEIVAKKELGIYEKMVRIAKIALELQELKLQVNSYHESYFTDGIRHDSKINQLTKEKMKMVKNGFHKKVDKLMNDMVYKIKLSGLDNETKSVFEELPEIIENLSKELKQLPPPTKGLKLIKGKKTPK